MMVVRAIRKRTALTLSNLSASECPDPTGLQKGNGGSATHTAELEDYRSTLKPDDGLQVDRYPTGGRAQWKPRLGIQPPQSFE